MEDLFISSMESTFSRQRQLTLMLFYLFNKGLLCKGTILKVEEQLTVVIEA